VAKPQSGYRITKTLDAIAGSDVGEKRERAGHALASSGAGKHRTALL
jgi:hypothetical protein